MLTQNEVHRVVHCPVCGTSLRRRIIAARKSRHMTQATCDGCGSTGQTILPRG